jgi:hypothetical protein
MQAVWRCWRPLQEANEHLLPQPNSSIWGISDYLLCHATLLYCRTFALRRSLSSSNRRRLDSSNHSILWASNVFTPAVLSRTMRPFCRCTRRSRFAMCFSTRRRSSSNLMAARRSSWAIAAFLNARSASRKREPYLRACLIK